MARTPFKLRSGNTSSFKSMGASPAKQSTIEGDPVGRTREDFGTKEIPRALEEKRRGRKNEWDKKGEERGQRRPQREERATMGSRREEREERGGVTREGRKPTKEGVGRLVSNPKMSAAEIANIKESDAYKKLTGEDQKFTSKEHEANKAGNAAIDQQMLDYRKAYYDKHGSSSGGSDAEFKAHQEGLDKLRSGYVNR